MRVIKKINNNAAICLDDNNVELVALGTGVGFPECPYDITDLSVIRRTYYDVDATYYDLLNKIPRDVLDVAIQIVDIYKEKASKPISSNVVFTLSDHINFAIERQRGNIVLNTPMHYDIQHFYEDEYKAGLEALRIIQKKLKVKLPKGEASNIAMHFINADVNLSSGSKQQYVDGIVDEISNIVGRSFRVYIDREGFNFARFATHIKYLLKRAEKGSHVTSDNLKMFNSVAEESPEAYQCVLKIQGYLKEEMNIELNEEELMYLILHVNRLCAGEAHLK